MNYLGHAYLSFDDADVLTGNMIGDHVKGLKGLEAYPEAIQRGLKLHRSIDQFTDEHPVMQQAKVIFRLAYGLYAGAITDTLTDYFLANDPALFPATEALQLFAAGVYARLESRQSYFPESFRAYFSSMKEHNWLLNYRSREGIYRSLRGLQRRAKYMADAAVAYDLFVQNEALLRTYYDSFIGDVISFVKIQAVSG